METLQTGRLTTVKITLNPHTCPTCCVVYGLSSELEQRRQETGENWYCPNGHSVVFRKSDVGIEKERREHAEREAAYWQSEADRHSRAHSATKGQLTKMRKRIQAGVCPHCNRTFQQLARHMERKHLSAMADTP
jgi:hypothetical protein